MTKALLRLVSSLAYCGLSASPGAPALHHRLTKDGQFCYYYFFLISCFISRVGTLLVALFLSESQSKIAMSSGWPAIHYYVVACLTDKSQSLSIFYSCNCTECPRTSVALIQKLKQKEFVIVMITCPHGSNQVIIFFIVNFLTTKIWVTFIDQPIYSVTLPKFYRTYLISLMSFYRIYTFLKETTVQPCGARIWSAQRLVSLGIIYIQFIILIIFIRSIQ